MPRRRHPGRPYHEPNPGGPGGGLQVVGEPFGAFDRGSIEGERGRRLEREIEQRLPRDASFQQQVDGQSRALLEILERITTDRAIRVEQRNEYFGKFAPLGVQFLRHNFFLNSPMAPGAGNTVVIGGFQVPEQMMMQIRTVRYDANRSGGAVQVPLDLGELAQYIGFAILVDGSMIGVQSFVQQPPGTLPGPVTQGITQGAFFGEYSAAQQSQPSLPRVHNAGIGEAMAPDHAYYISGGRTVAFIISVTAGLPVTLTSAIVRLDGLLSPEMILRQRLEY